MAPDGSWGWARPVVGGSSDPEIAETITESVLNVALPDEGDPDNAGEDHPWWWLASDRGLRASAEELRSLPYQVVLSDDVIRWLGSG